MNTKSLESLLHEEESLVQEYLAVREKVYNEGLDFMLLEVPFGKLENIRREIAYQIRDLLQYLPGTML